MLGHSRWSIYVARVLEEVVRLHLDQVGGHIPHVLPVVNDADHGITTGEQCPAEGENKLFE